MVVRCQMEIRAIRPTEFEVVRRLLLDNGFHGERITDIERFRKLIAMSQRALVAVADGSVIGFARGISDDVSNGYLSMLVVAEAHRRKGVGTALVRAVVGDDDQMTWVLRLGGRDVAEFYEKLGFVRSTVAMERIRAK